ncbi:MAG: protein kinase [Cyanobacteria bacterium J06621_11]
MATFSSNSIVAERLGDHYESIGPIGHPFGYQQMLAQDHKSKNPVVIKSLTIEENTPTGDICCFEREIHLLESLNHPTIPRYLNSFTVDMPMGKGLVLVQSHTGGQTLEEQLKSGRTFSETEIKAIAKQLLQGLIYFHSKGLVHRDIKPSNVAVAGSVNELGQATWLNLGTVQYIQAQRPDALVGSYGYMPPEQVGGQAAFASDLYSLGATLVYLTVGAHLRELPHDGPKVEFACSTKRLSANFQHWINWLIEPYVGDRPVSAKQALRALNHLPFTMLKHRFRPTSHRATKRAPMMPVPITTSGRNYYQPFFTKIRAEKGNRTLKLTIPATGFRSHAFRQSLPPLLIGSSMLASALYLMNLLAFASLSLTSPQGLATLAAAALAIVGFAYSFRFLKVGLSQLQDCLLKKVQIHVDEEVLLIANKYWLRSPNYIVNAKRECIYSISALPDGSALRILTHHNRTETSCLCYKLSVNDGTLSRRDIRWLTSLLNDWRSRSGF